MELVTDISNTADGRMNMHNTLTSEDTYFYLTVVSMNKQTRRVLEGRSRRRLKQSVQISSRRLLKLLRNVILVK